MAYGSREMHMMHGSLKVTLYFLVCFLMQKMIMVYGSQTVFQRNLQKTFLMVLFQWSVDHDKKKFALSSFGELDPNRSKARIGFIYPWALRPKLIRREAQILIFKLW
ncbi:hypothetical protein Ct9H90mP29_01430 [bacterium]|nr:MAG: hypothetical protein Ct9H90mP29_01430 [bacterium]